MLQMGAALNEYADPSNLPSGVGPFDFGSLDSSDGGIYPVSALFSDGVLFVAFVETQWNPETSLFVARGPIVKLWAGTSWLLVGTDMEPILRSTAPAIQDINYSQTILLQGALSDGDRCCPARPQICDSDDAAFLYCAYTVRVGADTPDGEGTWDARNVVIKRFSIADNTDWDLVTEIVAEAYNTWYGTGLDAGLGEANVGPLLAIGEIGGNVYVSFAEEGPQSGLHGHNAHNWRQRWHVRGFDSGGSQIYNHDLVANDEPAGFNAAILDPWFGQSGAGQHRFVRANGTLYLIYPSQATANAVDVLDVVADTITTVPIGVGFTSDFFADGVDVISACDFMRTDDGDMIYFGGVRTLQVEYASQIKADLTGTIDPLHGASTGDGKVNPFGLMDGIHAVDDQNVILVMYIPPSFDDPFSQYPTIFHDVCGPAVQDGDMTITDSGRLSSAFDSVHGQLLIVTERPSDGSVIAWSNQYIPDKNGCGGIPTFYKVTPGRGVAVGG